MPKDPIELLCTLGPASMNETVIGRLAELGTTLFRINLAHTKAGDLAQAIEFIRGDELVEVTPQSIRLRKRWLDPNMRKKMERSRERDVA